MTGINTRALDRELKRGSAELLILSLLDARPRHGYELSKLIHTRSGGQLTFHIDSLYPLLYRLEERGWIKGTWVEKPDERRRRFYKVTAEGQRVLAQQRKTWDSFVEAVRRGLRAEALEVVRNKRRTGELLLLLGQDSLALCLVGVSLSVARGWDGMGWDDIMGVVAAAMGFAYMVLGVGYEMHRTCVCVYIYYQAGLE